MTIDRGEYVDELERWLTKILEEAVRLFDAKVNPPECLPLAIDIVRGQAHLEVGQLSKLVEGVRLSARAQLHRNS